jgi:hypothetical protein
MDMIGHQAVGLNRHPVPNALLGKKIKVNPAVPIILENGAAMISTSG